MYSNDYKCPTCAAPLKFSPETGSWKCEFCNNDYKLSDLWKNEKNFSDIYENKEVIDGYEYICPDCGAKIITDLNTTATFCVYCGNTAIIKNRISGILKPEGIIPFSITKEKAIETFLEFRKQKYFLPKKFSEKAEIEKISGVYIPFWLFNLKGEGIVLGRAKKYSRDEDDYYIYDLEEDYQFIRIGSADFSNVPADGSKKFADDLMDSIEPFDFSKMEDFAPGYLSGFFAEKYDLNYKDVYLRARDRSEFSLINYLKDSIDFTEYSEASIYDENFKSDIYSIKYVLIPVWMMNIKYKKKIYTFAMNGETGKFVGKLPISITKFISWIILLFFIWFGIFYVLFDKAVGVMGNIPNILILTTIVDILSMGSMINSRNTVETGVNADCYMEHVKICTSEDRLINRKVTPTLINKI